MKVTEHIEQLLKQGRKPKELIELGFPKRVVTRVRRQLREKETVPQSRTQKGGVEPTPLVETTAVQTGLKSLEGEVQQLESRVEILEAISAKIEDIEYRLQGTPALGLKHRFKCDCGASGLVAVRFQCTKCGSESWWGWFPKE